MQWGMAGMRLFHVKHCGHGTAEQGGIVFVEPGREGSGRRSIRSTS